MTVRFVAISCCLAMSSGLFEQNKEKERLMNSNTVLQAILAGDNGLTKHILD